MTTTHPHSDLRAQYDTEGWCVARGVLDADLVGEASRHIDWLREKHPGLRPEHLGHTLMTDDPFWVRLISDDRLLDVAAQFIGPNLALFASHYISKPPRDGQPVLWHQDGSYWPLEPMQVVTLWLAVDDSTPENGCMRVIPRTHTMDLQQLQKRTDVANVLSSSLDPKLVDETKAVDVILKAGDVSIHHPNLIHGSNANHSPHRRAGLTIRYIPATTRITAAGQWPSAFFLRGQLTPGVNSYLPWPKYVEGKHMPFRDWQQWNRRCEERPTAAS
jgi:ectoine hydroxylase-related dioxygenase (phytanoyl-CoA dioxygenase family)